MIISLYLTLCILGIIAMLAAIYHGSVQDMNGQTGKWGATVILLIVSGLLFLGGALSSQNIDTESCHTQVNQTQVTGNTTTYVNSIMCNKIRHSEPGMMALLASFIVLDALLSVIYIFKNFGSE